MGLLLCAAGYDLKTLFTESKSSRMEEKDMVVGSSIKHLLFSSKSFHLNVQNSPSFCLGLVFTASSPLMVTLTMCVVLFDTPGSKQSAANKQTFVFQKQRPGISPFYKITSIRITSVM